MPIMINMDVSCNLVVYWSFDHFVLVTFMFDFLVTSKFWYPFLRIHYHSYDYYSSMFEYQEYFHALLKHWVHLRQYFFSEIFLLFRNLLKGFFKWLREAYSQED